MLTLIVFTLRWFSLYVHQMSSFYSMKYADFFTRVNRKLGTLNLIYVFSNFFFFWDDLKPCSLRITFFLSAFGAPSFFLGRNKVFHSEAADSTLTNRQEKRDQTAKEFLRLSVVISFEFLPLVLLFSAVIILSLHILAITSVHTAIETRILTFLCKNPPGEISGPCSP